MNRIGSFVGRLKYDRLGLLGLAIVLAVPVGSAAQDARFPLPPGTQIVKADSEALAGSSFRRDQPIVGTYFFYWYDDRTKEHFVDPDGSDALTDHPAESNGYSYRSPQWHRRELLEMHAAGLDFILPVYWGYPGDYESWSFVGLKALVAARRQLHGEGRACPRIGMFYDTSTLRHNRRGFHADLTTTAGKAWLYVTVRDFFVHVPQEHWATIEGRPLVWLYSANFAQQQDPAALDYVRREFKHEFGIEPFIVKEVSWQGRGDATYAWGAALKPNLYDVAAVGPGYNHSAVEGRARLVREREDGAFYRRSWEWMLARDPANRPAIAIIETWNEWHEGTDVAPSKEYGRQYVDLTKRYAGMWHSKQQLERTGKFARAKSVSVILADPAQSAGLVPFDSEDGKWQTVNVGGKAANQTMTTRFSGRYLYFDVDDSFFFQDGGSVEVEVEYFDESDGTLMLEYDSGDPHAPHGGAFKARAIAEQRGTRQWRTARLRLDDAAFSGRANGGDLRFSVPGGDAVLARCVVRKVDAAASPERGAK